MADQILGVRLGSGEQKDFIEARGMAEQVMADCWYETGREQK